MNMSSGKMTARPICDNREPERAYACGIDSMAQPLRVK